MLRLRTKTLKAFERRAHDAFAVEMMAHCREYSPKACASLSDEHLHEAVAQGIAQAEGHGFTQRGATRYFLDLMLLLGSGFDTDPQYPWAREVLARDDYRTPMDRAEALHERVTSHLESVGAERHAEDGRTFRRIAEELRIDPPTELDAGSLLGRMFPRKVAACGDSALQQLLEEGGRRADQRGLSDDPRHVLATVAMMFVFGHRFDTDAFLRLLLDGRSEDRSRVGQPNARGAVADGWLARSEAWFKSDAKG